MPPKKKKNNVLPSLSFVTSPTPSIIKFPHSESYSQPLPLEVPTVPYTEGGKWLSMHFTQSDTKHPKLPSRRKMKSKSDVLGIAPSNRKCAVVSGFEPEPQHHNSRRRSSTTYVPLEVNIMSRKTAKKRHARIGHEGKSDDVANNSSHSVDETLKAVSSVNNVSCMQTENMDYAPSLAFSVKTPELASGRVYATNSDKTLRLQRSCSPSNLKGSCQSDNTLKDLNMENDDIASLQRKGRCTLRLFQSSGSEDGDLEESEVLAPDTPEHECQFTFYQRRLKARIRGVKHAS